MLTRTSIQKQVDKTHEEAAQPCHEQCAGKQLIKTTRLPMFNLKINLAKGLSFKIANIFV